MIRRLVSMLRFRLVLMPIYPAAISGFADIPRVGDINGDGRADAFVVRNGLLTKDWFISYAANPGNPYPNNVNTTLTISNTISGYGAVAADAVVGDWDNDGDDNIGAFDNTATLTWNLDTNGGGGVEITKSFGLPGDQLIVGRWADVLWDGNQDGGWRRRYVEQCQLTGAAAAFHIESVRRIDQPA